jgi:dihydroorotase
MSKNLITIPALIDPHVHFRTPGAEHKENWQTGARAAIAGGVTTVFDMPNNTPACTTLERLEEKKQLIETQLAAVQIPLRYHLYLGASEHTIPEITRAAREYIGIKVFLGQSTGDLLMTNDSAFASVCQTAAAIGSVVAVHAEDEATMQIEKQKYTKEALQDVHMHSVVRSRQAAITALQKAVAMAKKYGTKMYILHASTKEEVELVRQAKKDGLNIALETTPHHLFLSEDAYMALGTRAQMNPPLRTAEDQKALWKGILDGTIDMIGTDHAPHTLAEKDKPYGEAPSGVPGIETLLPLLGTAVADGRMTVERLIAITSTNAQKFFGLIPNDDEVIIDMGSKKTVEGKNLKTKCAWSPFEGYQLTGWPVTTKLRGKSYNISSL